MPSLRVAEMRLDSTKGGVAILAVRVAQPVKG
jgi:hypothetical protein